MENNCKLCGTKYDFRMVQITKCLGTMGISLSGNVDQVNKENAFKFCPECGRKLTKENFDGKEIWVLKSDFHGRNEVISNGRSC